MQDPFEYEDSDALNVAVSGAKIPDLLNQTTNLRNQLKELNEVSNSYQLACAQHENTSIALFCTSLETDITDSTCGDSADMQYFTPGIKEIVPCTVELRIKDTLGAELLGGCPLVGGSSQYAIFSLLKT